MHSMLYVEAVDTKHIHTFLPITFLIFNGFSIRKMFWKAKTERFSTITSNTIYVNTVDTRQASLSVGKLRLRAFQPYHQILYVLILSTQDKDL